MAFTLKGSQLLKRNIEKIGVDIKLRINPAIRYEAENVMARSKREFVPIDDGTLRDSGYVSTVKDVNGEHRVEFGFSARHAVAVHETPSQHDPPTWRGKRIQFRVGGRKYLEKPLMEAAGKMGEKLAKKLKVRKP